MQGAGGAVYGYRVCNAQLTLQLPLKFLYHFSFTKVSRGKNFLYFIKRMVMNKCIEYWDVHLNLAVSPNCGRTGNGYEFSFCCLLLVCRYFHNHCNNNPAYLHPISQYSQCTRPVRG